MVNVKNRNNGNTGYTLADGGIRRQFMPGEVKQIDEKELRQLVCQPGGQFLLENYLIIDDPNLIAELIGNIEPEYNYTEKEIRELLEKGSEDQLKDCLDFAPEGVKELVKDIAVKIRLNDMRKRDIISKAFNFDINTAINFKEEDSLPEQPAKTQRRATPMGEAAASAPVRKAPVYNVVKK